MKALLLIAHGSRKERANNEIAQLADHLESNDQTFDQIQHAFLEMAEPSIPDSIKGLVENGANEITVLPYFLAYGSHVGSDIPDIIQTMREQHPNVTFTITDHIGSTGGMRRMLLMHLQQISFRKS